MDNEKKEDLDESLGDTKRKVFTVNKDVLSGKAKSLYFNKMPFTLVSSGSSNELYSDIFNCRSINKSFDIGSMNFVKKVKKYVIDNSVALKFIDKDYRHSEINYISVKNSIRKGDVFENVCCLDIKNAYWQTALLMGIISKEIYEDGVSKNKVTRLASLGSMAKRKEVYEFDGNVYRHVETIRNYETENIWFAICKHVSDIMGELVKTLGEDFLFYWVDGIYFKNTEDNVKKVSDLINSCSYDCKPEEVSKIEFFNDHFVVYSKLGRLSKTFGWRGGYEEKTRFKMPSIEIRSLVDMGNKFLKEK